MKLDEHARTNHAWWEERARLHPDTPMYREYAERLRAGSDPLYPIEVQGVGDVRGRRLLHVQCHIGTDTLAWARRGARVTGVDFSATALDQARSLARELGLTAEFVHARAEALPAELRDFDVVFSSYGAIHWLRDLRGWAAGIARALRPGGFFFLVDAHPMLYTIDEDAAADGATLRVGSRYFESDQPLVLRGAGSYADRALATRANETREWPHSLSELLSCLLDAGLRLDAFGEHRAAPWQALPCCERGDDGLYRLPPALADRLPLLFSLRARRPHEPEGP